MVLLSELIFCFCILPISCESIEANLGGEFTLEARKLTGYVGETFTFQLHFRSPIGDFQIFVYSNSSEKREYSIAGSSGVDLCMSTYENDEPDFPDYYKDRRRHLRQFQYVFSHAGKYMVNATLVKSQLALFKTVTITVSLPKEFVSKTECEDTIFLVNKKELSTYLHATTLSVDFSDWVKLESLTASSSCLGISDAAVRWTIEKLAQASFTETGTVPLCLHPSRIGQVNLTSYITKYAIRALPVSLGEHELTLQPYSLSPGLYRICLRLYRSRHFRVCGFLVREAKVPDVSDMILATPTPREDYFHWPDDSTLTLDSQTDTYFYYANPDSGNTGEIKLRIRWKCHNNLQSCKYFAKKTKLPYERYGRNDLLLNHTRFTLSLHPKLLEITGFTLNFSAELYIEDTLTNMIASKVKHWTVSFSDVSYPFHEPYIGIRCYRQCEREIIPLSLLLIALCTGCEHLERDFINVTWGISIDEHHPCGSKLMYTGSLNWYYNIDFLKLGLTSFSVCVLLTYYSEDGEVLIEATSSRQLRVSSIFKNSKPLVLDIEPDNSKFGDLRLVNIFDVRLRIENITKTRITDYPLAFFYFDYDDSFGVIASSIETHTTLILGTFELPTMLLVGSFGTIGYIQNCQVKLNVTSVVDQSQVLVKKEVVKIYEVFVKTYDMKLFRVFLLLAANYFQLNPTQTISMARFTLTRFLRMRSIRMPVMSDYKAILRGLVRFLGVVTDQDITFLKLVIKVVEHIFQMDQLYSIHGTGKINMDYSYYLGVLEKLFGMLGGLMMQHRNLTSLEDLHLDKNPTAFNRDLIAVQQKLLHTLKEFTDALPRTISEIYPSKLKMKTQQFEIQACWADSSRQEVVALQTQKVDIYVLLYVQLEMFHPLTLDTNMHISAVVHEMYLPATFFGVPLNAPEVHISLQQKTYNPYPLTKNYLDIFDIFYHYDEADEANKYTITYEIDTDSDNITRVVDSDCFIFQLSTSSVTDTLLKIRSASGYRLIITAYKQPQQEILDIFDQEVTQLPYFANDSVSGTEKDPNSILLPKLTKMEHATMKTFNWSVMISLAEDIYEGAASSPNLLKEDITVSCQRLACVKLIQLDQSWTDKDCHATEFSSGKPNLLNCLCSSGETFTGGVSSCGSDMIVPWKYAPIKFYALRSFQNVSLRLNVYLSALWLVFIAVLMTSSKMDKLHKPMNKTNVQPDMFSPFDKYKYLLCVVTGWFHSSGVLVVPTITIVGSNSISRKYQLHLTDCYYKAGSESWFLISSRLYLGNLQYAIVTLERNDIESVWWSVSTIYMRDILMDTDYYCSLNTVLSSSPDGEPTVKVKEFTSHVMRKANIFHRFVYFMVALHLFSGIFYSVPGSKFNKTQHVLSCFMSILLIMSLLTRHVLDEDFQQDTEFFKFSTATIKVSAAVSISSILVNTLISFSDQSFKGKNRVHWYTPFVHTELSRNLEDSIRRMRKMNITGLPNDKLDLNRFLSTIETRLNVSPFPWNESAVDREFRCEFRETIYGHIVRRAINGRNLVAMSSLQLLLAHRREREKRSLTSVIVIHGAPIESIKASENYKILHKIVLWLSLPNYVIRAVLVMLIVTLTYVPFVSGFQLDAVILRAYLASTVNCLIGSAILLQPSIILLIAFLLSDRWPQHKFDADCRVRDIYKALELKIKMMKAQKIEAPKDSEESLVYTAEYVKLIRKKCRVYSLTKDKKEFSNSFQSNMFLIGAFIAVMFLVIQLHHQNTSSRFLQSAFLDRILKERGPAEVIQIESIWKSLTTTLYYGLRKHLVNINTTASFYMVSAVRLRQIRLVPDKEYDKQRECIYSPYLFQNCTKLTQSKKYDTRNYAYTWAKLSPRDIGDGPYTHLSRKPIFAEITGGGGYEAMYDLKSLTPYMLKDLKARGWIDRHTRSIIIDLVVYNADTDMTTNIILNYDFTDVAIVRKTYYAYTFLMSMSEGNDMLLAICEILFLVHTFINIYTKVKQLNGLGYKSLFDSKEAMLTTLEPFLYVATIFFRALEIMEKSVIVQGIQQSNVESKESTYVNFIRFYTLSYILLILYICITALNFVRVFHSISNNRHVRIFVALVPELYDVVKLIFLCILFMNFLGRLVFPESRNFSRAFFSVINTLGLIFSSLGKDREGESVDLYVMSCSFFLNFVVINHFVAVMNVLYNRTKLRYPQSSKGRRVSIV